MEITPRKRHIENTVISCPIVYGSVAHWMGKRAEEAATHKWTLFVRGPRNEDLSVFISQVAFTLHPSFSEPVRVIKQPPFEVSESGWGEFESSIRIYFKDFEEDPIDLFHVIKLYYPPPAVPSLKKPVVSEKYDEIIFTDPSEKFYNCLVQYGSCTCPFPTLLSQDCATIFDDTSDVQQLTIISNHLQREIEAAKVRFLQLDIELARIASLPATAPSKASGGGEGGGVTTTAKENSSGTTASGGRVRDRSKKSASNSAASSASVAATTTSTSNNTPTEVDVGEAKVVEST